MSDLAAWISAGAAGVSVGAAVWATMKGAKAQKASSRVQRKLVEIEQARDKERTVEKSKAKLAANPVKRMNRRGIPVYQMEIVNQGLAAAKKVVVKIEEGHRWAARANREIPEIGAASSYMVPLDATKARVDPFKVELAWEDDSGESGRYKTTMSF